MYKFRNIFFEDIERGEEGVWTNICASCAKKFNIEDRLLDDAGQGCCMVYGCPNEDGFYINFHDDEMPIEVSDDEVPTVYQFTVTLIGTGDTPEEAWAHAVSTAAEQLGQDCPDDFVLYSGQITETSNGTYQG